MKTYTIYRLDIEPPERTSNKGYPESMKKRIWPLFTIKGRRESFEEMDANGRSRKDSALPWRQLRPGEALIFSFEEIKKSGKTSKMTRGEGHGKTVQRECSPYSDASRRLVQSAHNLGVKINVRRGVFEDGGELYVAFICKEEFSGHIPGSERRKNR